MLVLSSSPLPAQKSDPVFSQISFDRWLTEKSESHFHWNASIGPPKLSTHQRFIGSVTVTVDGAEIARRRGEGKLLVLVEARDDQGRAWQNHQELDLAQVEAGMKANNVEFGQLFFVLPGDYQMAIAIYDDATGEHSLLLRRLHVPPLKNDPLPGAWRGLPPVEFIPEVKPPENWYLPSITGRLNLAVSAHEPVHVRLLVNLTPSGRLAASTNAQTRVFEVLIPAAKLLSYVDWGGAPFGISFLDLPKQRVVYQQDDARAIDWSRAAGSLMDVNAGTIDARTLEQRHLSADFFVGEVRWEVTQSKNRATPVLIILSGAIRFDENQELIPIRRDDRANPKVFYIRYQPVQQLVLARPGPGASGRAIRTGYPVIDQLEPLLKPLDPRLYEVTTQEQVRHALAAIFAEISKL